MIILAHLRGSCLMSCGECGPNGRQDDGNTPAERQVEFVISIRPEDHHCDEIVEEKALDEHPDEHCSAGVFEDDVKPLTQNRLLFIWGVRDELEICIWKRGEKNRKRILIINHAMAWRHH